MTLCNFLFCPAVISVISLKDAAWPQEDKQKQALGLFFYKK